MTLCVASELVSDVSLVGSCHELRINVADKLRTLQRKSTILRSVGALSVFQTGGLRRSSQ